MRITLRTEEASLVLEPESLLELDQFFDQAQKDDGFFCTLDRQLELYQPLTCSVSTSEGFAAHFNIEVVQVFAEPGDATSFGTALRVLDWGSIPTASIKSRLGASAAAASTDSPAPCAAKQKTQLHSSEVSPIYRIREMKPPELIRLARRAGRIERQILLRRPTAQVLLALLTNPHLEDSDVLEIVKSNFATGAIMQRVASTRKWIQNQEIQLAVVKSPKTPAPVVRTLLPLLPTPQLRKLSKMGNAREELRKAAFRIYLQRTKRRGGSI